jgi:hypothetical protein
MTLNPSHDLKVLLPQLLNTLKQAMQDPESVDIDLGQAQEVRDALNNIINAKQQQQQGGKSGKSGSKDDEKDDDKKDDDSQKKSQY